MLKLMGEADVNRATIVELEANAALLKAQAEDLVAQQELTKITQQISAAKAAQDGVLKYMSILQDSMAELNSQQQEEKKQAQQAAQGAK